MLPAMAAQPVLVQEVVTDFVPVTDQHRYPGTVAADQTRIAFDIDRAVAKVQLMTQALQRLRHVRTEMAAPAHIDCELTRHGASGSGLA